MIVFPGEGTTTAGDRPPGGVATNKGANDPPTSYIGVP